MRPDVKLGVVISMAVVLVAGGYYMYRDGQVESIPVAAAPVTKAPDALAAKKAQRKTPPAKVKERNKPRVRENVTGSRSVQLAKKPKDTDGSRAATAKKATSVSPAGRNGAKRMSGDKAGRPTPVSPAETLAKRGGRRGPGEPRVARAVPKQPGERKTARPVPSGGSRAVRPEEEHKRPVTLTAKKPSDAATDPTGRKKVAVDTHRIQLGDTFSSLAVAYYGSAKYAGFLMNSNPQITDPKRLAVGTIVKIPPRPSDDVLSAPKSADVRGTPAGEPAGERRTYRVRPGDSFYAIAKNVLGDASRWKELFELNKDLVNGDPTRLQVDQVLVLPDS